MNQLIDISGVTLATQRLVLRPWAWTDLADFYEYASVDGVGQMAGWLPHQSIEESRMVLGMFIEGKKTFAIEHEGKVIGSLGVEEYDEEKLPEFADRCGRELGFVLAKPCWGRGLMPEAVQAVIRYLFDEVGLDFLVCCHFADNAQSCRVQEKCGFRHYKLIQSETRYGLVKDAWASILEK